MNPSGSILGNFHFGISHESPSQKISPEKTSMMLKMQRNFFEFHGMWKQSSFSKLYKRSDLMVSAGWEVRNNLFFHAGSFLYFQSLPQLNEYERKRDYGVGIDLQKSDFKMSLLAGSQNLYFRSVYINRFYYPLRLTFYSYRSFFLDTENYFRITYLADFFFQPFVGYHFYLDKIQSGFQFLLTKSSYFDLSFSFPSRKNPAVVVQAEFQYHFDSYSKRGQYRKVHKNHNKKVKKSDEDQSFWNFDLSDAKIKKGKKDKINQKRGFRKNKKKRKYTKLPISFSRLTASGLTPKEAYGFLKTRNACMLKPSSRRKVRKFGYFCEEKHD